MRNIVLLTLLMTPIAFAAKHEISPADQQRLKSAVDEAIEKKQCPGAVLLVGDKSGTIFLQAYGNRSVEPDKVPMTTDTIFDMASVSKSVGCATSIMILADRGKLSVTDPVSRYIPQMDRPDKESITIEQCLLHRAGFVPDNTMKDYVGTHEQMMDKVYATKLQYEPGTDFTYSDLSFIVLGEVVQKVSGEPLTEFTKKNIYEPLKMKDSGYMPDASLRERIAPTEKRDGKFIIGEVHDPRAYALGGFAGHAGLFSTAEDIGCWCRMLLNGGDLDSVRIMSAVTVADMTKKRCLPNGKSCRGYGLDFTSGLSNSPRGDRFAPGETFGHTGWTGTMFWIDPKNQVFFVLLTNRVHPDGKGDVKELRHKVSTIVAEALLGKN